MARTRTWIVVADTSGARLFQQPRPGAALEPAEPAEMTPAPIADYADRPGRVHERHGDSRHGMEPKTDAQTVQRDAFAGEIADALNRAAEAHAYDALIVAAPPALLGALRKRLADNASDRIKAELDKNLTQSSVHELPAHLQEFLHFADSPSE